MALVSSRQHTFDSKRSPNYNDYLLNWFPIKCISFVVSDRLLKTNPLTKIVFLNFNLVLRDICCLATKPQTNLSNNNNEVFLKYENLENLNTERHKQSQKTFHQKFHCLPQNVKTVFTRFLDYYLSRYKFQHL